MVELRLKTIMVEELVSYRLDQRRQAFKCPEMFLLRPNAKGGEAGETICNQISLALGTAALYPAKE